MNQYTNPIYQNQYQNYPNRFANPSNGIVWVQGIEGAKAYQLIPNSNIILMDSENDGRFYIKVSDNVGMCSLRTFKFEEITSTPNNTQTTDMSIYVTKDELEAILASKLNGGNNDVKQSVPTANGKTISK